MSRDALVDITEGLYVTSAQHPKMHWTGSHDRGLSGKNVNITKFGNPRPKGSKEHLLILGLQKMRCSLK